MATARQLHHLQEIDQQIKSAEDAIKSKEAQQCESEALITARLQAVAGKQRLDELKKRQHGLEVDVSGLVAKIADSEQRLYGGRIMNPKELTSLQAEVKALKARRDQIENELLQVMDEVENAEKGAVDTADCFNKVETQWRKEQEKLSEEIARIKERLTGLKKSFEAISCEIDAASLELYERLKKSRGEAVARVEQGICRGCRISLSSAELQRARGGALVTCSSCGRIIFLP